MQQQLFSNSIHTIAQKIRVEAEFVFPADKKNLDEAEQFFQILVFICIKSMNSKHP